MQTRSTQWCGSESSTDHSGSRVLAHLQLTKGHIDALQLWMGATFKATNTYFIVACVCQSVSKPQEEQSIPCPWEGSCFQPQTWFNWVMLHSSPFLESDSAESVREAGNPWPEVTRQPAFVLFSLEPFSVCFPVLHLWSVGRKGTAYHLQGITLLPSGIVGG